ncbi:MAG: TRAP transporter small permease [Bacteroidetes bacterium]|nr:TRAP transporter small permease [Bacteroidota bacterium]MBU1677249.1 TRAP transporter small permease [Bacteroidota bacterium]MBU2505882.1 TRAP transporter small permease [Bacteroidota bacterium]
MILEKIKFVIDSILRWMLVFMMAVMTINVLWQVFSRFILQNPSSFTEELARYLLIWIGILGAGYVAGQKMHLAIDLLPSKLKGKRKFILENFIQLAILFFALTVMVIGGVRLVFITLHLEQISAALQIPLGYVYSVVPLSGAVIIFYSVYHLVKSINQLKQAQ